MRSMERVGCPSPTNGGGGAAAGGKADGKGDGKADEATERARKAKEEADAARIVAKEKAAADSAAAQQKMMGNIGMSLGQGVAPCGASQGASGAYPPPKELAKIATVGSENSLPGPGRGAGPPR